MAKSVLTEKNKLYIRANRLLKSSGEMAKEIGCSKTPVQLFLRQSGLSVPKEVIDGFRKQAMTGRSTSSPAIDRKLRKLYLTIPEKRLAVLVGRSSTFVRCRLRQLELFIPREIIVQRKQDSRIQPGTVPANKGKKQVQYMSKAAIQRTLATRFKKGNLPVQTKKDWEVTIRTDTRGIKYKHIRIALAKWVPLHRYIWEKANGKIPRGKKVAFKDGNTMNCQLSNLEMITAAELMKRNSIHNFPAPIAQAVQLRGALNRQINKHIKKLKNEK